jgi:hypothetical protein
VLARTDEKRRASPRWEYLVLYVSGHADPAELRVISVEGEAGGASVLPGATLPDALRALGLERWELVAAVLSETGRPASMYIFKRPCTQRPPAHLDLVEEERDSSV